MKKSLKIRDILGYARSFLDAENLTLTLYLYTYNIEFFF